MSENAAVANLINYPFSKKYFRADDQLNLYLISKPSLVNSSSCNVQNNNYVIKAILKFSV